MVTILRPNVDFYKIKVGEVSFHITPLTVWQKKRLMELVTMKSGEAQEKLVEYSILIVKFCLKKIEGIKTVDGDDYALEFIGDELTDDSISAIATLEQNNKLVNACYEILISNSGSVKDFVTGNTLEGVEIEGPVSEKKKIVAS